jgi:hypothetical protein
LIFFLFLIKTKLFMNHNRKTMSFQKTFSPATGQLPLETRLAVGILSLENGELAVTPEQAQTLLPLWKAIKTLSSSDTASNRPAPAHSKPEPGTGRPARLDGTIRHSIQPAGGYGGQPFTGTDRHPRGATR